MNGGIAIRPGFVLSIQRKVTDVASRLLVYGLVAAALLLLVSISSVANAHQLEVSLLGTYRFGSTVQDRANSDSTKQRIDDAAGATLLLDVPFYEDVSLQFLFSNQPTQLKVSEGFLRTVDDGADIDVQYFHVGLNGEKYYGRKRFFIDLGLGMTRFDSASNTLSDDSEFSMHLGAGLKFDLTPAISLRLDTRGFVTNISSIDDQPCESRSCQVYNNNVDFSQFEMGGGISVRF